MVGFLVEGSLFYQFQNQFGTMVLLENPTGLNCQPYSCWLELKNLGVVFLLQFSTYFVQSISTSGMETGPQHDATTTLLDSWSSVLRFESLAVFISVAKQPRLFLI
ncbi:hypothetical protein XENORESO_009352 [Xenotaenia resolanae]|uniref:Uncharacterized protein n=1 Tax=Xenotaenia resolanae TaxID=208358 RepID=A0ABV0WAR8_9TELE